MKTEQGKKIRRELTAWHSQHQGASVLRDLDELRDCIDGAIRGQVELLREVGAPWEAIGSYLGISRQSAWERFANVDTKGRRDPHYL